MSRFLQIAITILLIMGMTACNRPVSNTTSYIQVLDKEMDKTSHYFITVKNPYDETAKPFKITIKDLNLWNIIEVDKIYFSTYEYKNINEKVDLIEIKLPSETADDHDSVQANENR